MTLSRRAWLAGSLLVPLALARPALAAPDVRRASRALMGTRVDIVAQAPDGALLDAALAAAFAEMARLEAQMSRFRGDSAVARLQAAAGRRAVAVEPPTLDVLAQAQRLSRRSGGRFDITVGAYSEWGFEPGQTRLPSASRISEEIPLVDFRDVLLDSRAGTAFLRRPGMKLDLGGIAKIPILESGMRVLQEYGVRDAMVNGGGDVRVAGRLQGRPWRVGVRDPRSPERLLGVVELEQGWVASSGDYERCFEREGRRYHHILDPRTGYPTRGPRGVVLVGEDVAQVNGLGAALMVGGWQAGRPWLPAGTAALLVERDGAVRRNEGWQQLRVHAA